MLASIGLLGLLSSSQAVPIARERSAARAYQLPLTFEINQGQTDDRVNFLARGPGYNIFLTATEAVFALPEASTKSAQRPVMRMQLVGSAADPAVQGVEALPGKVNYFRGQDVANWQTKVPTYRRVKYSAVYPGVDLVYYGQSQQLEYDFIVAPGADPGSIKLGFAGVEQTTVDAQGDLVLKTAGGPLRFQKPVIYQVDNGRRHTIDGGYVQRNPHEIGFRVGTYDRTRPLIIDPILSYSTYLGGSGVDEGNGIAVDATGAAYVSGTTSSTDFPTVNPAQPTLSESGSVDIFIAKFTPDGTTLVYATYLGGSKDDGAADIAVDSAGNVYISAVTRSSDFPTVHALQPTQMGLRDAVVAKLSADGSRLIYSTYLASTIADARPTIAVDVAGSAYIANMTFSGDPYVSKLAPDGSALLYSTDLGSKRVGIVNDIALDSLGAAYVTGMVAYGESVDASIAKLAPDGRIIYSTHFGGSGSDGGSGIAIDISGAAYLTGWTASTDFPTKNALQPQQRSEFANAFVVKIAPEGDAMIYGTYLGGTRGELGYGIAVDTAGAAYVTGTTSSRDFPTMNALQPASGGLQDAFVSKLSPDGASLVYSTYLGGTGYDGIARFDIDAPRAFVARMAITVDLAGATYVTGQTQSPNFPTVNALQPVFHGDVCASSVPDAFVVKITDDSLASPAAGASIAGAPTNESMSASSPRGGGGAMDAFFLVLLAQLALAGALRRRCVPGQ